MAGYSDTRQLIIDTLMGRPAGTEIQPEDHQAFALALNDYIRSVELVAGSGVPVDFAEPDTVPVQPDNGQAVYLSYVPRSSTKNFVNFINQSGNSISVTSSSGEVKLVTLLWNGLYWSSQIVTIDALSDYLTTTSDLSNNVIGDENLLDVLNAKLTSNSILPFDGVLGSSVTLSQVSVSDYHIYYSTQLDMFVARSVGVRDGSYTNTFLGEDTTYISTKYNVNNVADKTKLYVDTNGSVYAFVNNQLTKVVDFNNGFTENPVANLAIKELYLQGLAEDESYYIHAIFRNYYEESISMYKCQISIMDSSDTLVAQYYDQTADMHKPNSIITFTTENSSGVSGNAVIDWDSVIEKSRWFLSTYDGKAFITHKVKELSFSPTIYAYLNELDSIKFTNETEVEL